MASNVLIIPITAPFTKPDNRQRKLYICRYCREWFTTTEFIMMQHYMLCDQHRFLDDLTVAAHNIGIILSPTEYARECGLLSKKSLTVHDNAGQCPLF